MKKVGLIGVGVISKHILYGLKFSQYLKLVSYADIKLQAKNNIESSEYNFYIDYKEMITQEKLDYVIIASPPATHYQIIKDCLNLGVNVIVEKPAVLDLREWDELVKISHEKNLVFEVIYHWQNGAEVLELLKSFQKKGLKKIKISSNDPYTKDRKNAISDRVGLGGSWIDSGVNILSLLKLFLPFNHYEIVSANNILCESYKIPIASKVNLVIDDINIVIEVDWRNNLNQKITEFEFENEKVILHHTKQSIIYNDIIKKCSLADRLNTHYKNYFTKFNGKSDLDSGRKIHEILLKVRDFYEKN